MTASNKTSMIARFSGEAGMEKLIEALCQQPIVGGDRALAQRIASRGQLEQFNTGDTLCEQDDCDDDVFLLLQGTVEILVNHHHIGTRSNDLVGEMAGTDPTARRSATVRATTHVLALKLSAEDFDAAGGDAVAFWRYRAKLPGVRLRERAKFHVLPNQTPILFVGSSVEGLPVARAVEAGLRHDKDVIVKLWTIGGVFPPSGIPVDDLIRQVAVADFALFVIGPDDKLQSRDESHATPRDNVIFEMGLFMGRLGRERVFMIREAGVDLKIPSDLTGVTPITYKLKNGGDISGAIGPVCTDLRKEIAAKGAMNRMRAET